MSFEQMRTEMTARLTGSIPAECVNTVLKIFDEVAGSYDIKRAETALSIVGNVPEVVKFYIASLMVERKAKGTVEGYHAALVTFFNTVRKPLADITTNDIRIYLYRYKEERGIEDTTLEHIRIIINAFFNWCVHEDFLLRNPAAKISPIRCQSKIRHALSMIDLERMRSACKTLRQKAMLDFMFSTGCRVSEVANVTIQDIDWSINTVIVQHGKGNKQRVVFLNPEAVISLKAYLNSRKDSDHHVFVSTRGAHGMTTKSLFREIDTISALAGVGHVHPHILRHTMATVALRNGMPVEQVKELLGHERIDTTMIYAEIDRSSVAMNHQKFVS